MTLCIFLITTASNSTLAPRVLYANVMPTDTRIADRVVTLIAEARAIRDGIFNDLVSETDVRKT